GFLRPAEPPGARPDLPVRDRLLVVVELLPDGPSPPRRDRLVELPPVRPEPQHRSRLRFGQRAPAGDANRLSRHAAPLAHPPPRGRVNRAPGSAASAVPSTSRF